MHHFNFLNIAVIVNLFIELLNYVCSLSLHPVFSVPFILFWVNFESVVGEFYIFCWLWTILPQCKHFLMVKWGVLTFFAHVFFIQSTYCFFHQLKKKIHWLTLFISLSLQLCQYYSMRLRLRSPNVLKFCYFLFVQTSILYKSYSYLT